MIEVVKVIDVVFVVVEKCPRNHDGVKKIIIGKKEVGHLIIKSSELGFRILKQLWKALNKVHDLNGFRIEVCIQREPVFSGVSARELLG